MVVPVLGEEIPPVRVEVLQYRTEKQEGFPLPGSLLPTKDVNDRGPMEAQGNTEE